MSAILALALLALGGPHALVDASETAPAALSCWSHSYELIHNLIRLTNVSITFRALFDIVKFHYAYHHASYGG